MSLMPSTQSKDLFIVNLPDVMHSQTMAKQPITPHNAHTIRQIAQWGTGAIYSLSYSPDGTRLALLSSQGIWLYDAHNLAKKPSLIEGDYVYGHKIAFNLDVSWLAIASEEGNIQLWDVTGTEPPILLEGHTDIVTSVAFNPDSTLLASSSFDGTIRLWNLESGEVRIFMNSAASRFESLTFSPDGLRLAGVNSGQIVLWDTATAQQLTTFTFANGSLNTIAFSPDETLLAVGGYFGEVWLVDIGSGLKTILDNGNPLFEHLVGKLAFNPAGTLLASATFSVGVQLWDISRKQSSLVLGQHLTEVTDIDFSADGAMLAAADIDGSVWVWNSASGQVEVVLDEGGHNAIFSPDGMLFASVLADNSIRIRNITTGEADILLGGGMDEVVNMVFSPNGTSLALTRHNDILLVNIASGELVNRFQRHTSAVTSLAFNGDTTLLASSSYAEVIVWDVTKGEPITVLEGQGPITTLAFSALNNTLALGSFDGTLQLFNFTHPEAEITVAGHSNYVTSVAFSPDGTRLASAGAYDGTARLWDVASGKQVAVFDSNMLVFDVVFNPDGKLLAWSSGGWIVIWDVIAEKELAGLNSEATYIESLAFSPDGSRLISATDDGIIHLWGLPNQEIIPN